MWATSSRDQASVSVSGQGHSAFSQQDSWLTVQKNKESSSLFPPILKNGMETVSWGLVWKLFTHGLLGLRNTN